MADPRVASRHSWWILVGCAVLAGAALLRIVLAFLLPLLLALAAALVFRPAYERMVEWFSGSRRIAALLATTGIVLIVVLPIAGVLFLAGQQMVELSRNLAVDEHSDEGRLHSQLHELRETMSDNEYASWQADVLDGRPTNAVETPAQNEDAIALLNSISQSYSTRQIADELARPTTQSILEPEKSVWLTNVRARLAPYVGDAAIERLTRSVSSAISQSLSQVYERTTRLLSNAVAAAIGFAVMAVAVYYFLAEGPELASAAKALLPLGDFEEAFLLHRFDELCRGVIVGTIASAVLQGVLMGIGLAIAGTELLWLLTGLTVVFSMIPFLGAAGVYVPVATVLAFRGQYGAAAFLMIYGIAVVSTSDNLVRMHVLQGRAQLHPLVGLVSMLGGVEVLGLWGIFVGPILAGLFYSLVRLVQARAPSDSKAPAPSSPADTPKPRSAETGIVLVTE